MQIIATHEVKDVEHWFTSPKRAEFFGPLGITAKAFRNPEGDGSVTAILIETPDMETFQNALAQPGAQEAEEYDGVLIDTLRVYVAG